MATYMAVVMARMADAKVPPFEFTRLVSAIDLYWKEVSKLAVEKKVELAASFEKAYAVANGSAASRGVYMTERALQLSAGLPGRPWYRHSLTAPGQYTGYGAKTLPGVREALELGKLDEEADQASELVPALERFNTALAEAVRQLRG